METKTQYIKRLKTELREVRTEIEQQIGKLDKLSLEIKQGYEELETALEDKQALAQAKLREVSMSGNEVWDLVWDNVWYALKEFNRKATTEIRHDYRELEPALRAKQSALHKQLPESALAGDEIWDEVWNEVWSVGEKFNSKAAIEIKQLGDELQALLDKQLALQSKLHEILVSGDEVWNVVKEVTNAMVNGTAR